MISKYNTFLLDSLLESILSTSDDFRKIIHDMPSNDEIADILFIIIKTGTDIKTNYNAIDFSKENNDEVTFIPDTQYQRFTKDGQDPWAKTKSISKIGRMIRQILNDNPEACKNKKYNDSDIEVFVNSYKNTWNKKYGMTNRKIEVVTGDKILYWYKSDNYLSSDGTLGNSCMRYEKCNDFMKIYADNPDKISMVILTEDDKLIGRALIWKLDKSNNGKKIYLDRVYVANDSDYQFITDWVITNVCGNDKNIMGSFKQQDTYGMICNLNKVLFDKYPYADTFKFLHVKLVDGNKTDDGFISESFNKTDGYIIYSIQEVDGESNCKTHQYSNYLSKWIPKDDSVFIKSIDSYVPSELTKICRYYSRHFLISDVIFSEKMNDWIPIDKSINNVKYGIILQDVLIKVCTGYNGVFKDPIDIINDIEHIEINECYEDEITHFKPSNLPKSLKDVNFSEELRCKDIKWRSQVNFLCYEIYETLNVVQLGIPCISTGNYFVNKLDSELFKIDIHDTKYFIYYGDYVKSQYKIKYEDLINKIKSTQSTDELKTKRIDFTTKIHNYLLENDTQYKLFVKIGSPEEIFDDVFNKVISLIDYKPIVVNYIMLNVVPANDELINKYVQLMKPMIYYWLYYGDGYEAKERVEEEFIYNNNNSYKIDFEDVLSSKLRMCFKNELMDKVRLANYNSYIYIIKKYNLDINSDDLYNENLENIDKRLFKFKS